MGWKNLTAPEYQGDPDRLHEENAFKGIDKTYQKEYIHKDGHRVPIYLITEPIFDEQGKPNVAQSLVRIGANLEGISTYSSLEQALRSIIGERHG